MIEQEPEKTALYIGRFQPFHNGHLAVVKDMDQTVDIHRILIGIGSAQEYGSPTNPFSAAEREQMIKQSLTDIKKPWETFMIPDTHNDQKWLEVIRLLTPREYQVVYSNNPHVEGVFKNQGIEVRNPATDQSICGTQIRELIRNGGNWAKHLPQGSERFLRRLFAKNELGVTVDTIINFQNQGVVLVKRRHNPDQGKWAITGGFLEVGQETLADASKRESNEETRAEVNITRKNYFGYYDDPKRDARGHIISHVFYADLAEGQLTAQDDAAEVRVFPWDQIPWEDLAFDHRQILADFKNWRGI